jgi:hypothetical protein
VGSFALKKTCRTPHSAKNCAGAESVQFEQKLNIIVSKYCSEIKSGPLNRFLGSSFIENQFQTTDVQNISLPGQKMFNLFKRGFLPPHGANRWCCGSKCSDLHKEQLCQMTNSYHEMLLFHTISSVARRLVARVAHARGGGGGGRRSWQRGSRSKCVRTRGCE